MTDVIALVDCNNFFVSCERIFNPKIANKPTVVLSNNDGCTIARSNEAKALGIKMGQPFFKWKHLVKPLNIQVFSPNFPLYGDISDRIMSLLYQFAPKLEIYSIDEAFLMLKATSEKQIIDYARDLQNVIKKYIGIPVSIGIAPTKTLAKAASEIAKKDKRTQGIFTLLEQNKITDVLKTFPVENIWGIGRKHTIKLQSLGIATAHDLIQKNDGWIRKNLTIMGLRLTQELQGIPCLALEEMVTKKSILSSRSFRNPLKTLEELQEPVASYMSQAAEKLRKQHTLATVVTVFIHTSYYAGQARYGDSKSIVLSTPSAFTPTLIKAAHQGLGQIYKRGYLYKKAGVVLSGLIADKHVQLDLFSNEPVDEKKQVLMQIVDKINSKNGKAMVSFASTGLKKTWSMRQDFRSPNFTTDWKDLLTLKI